ncbi:UvrD/REP helicase [Methanolacinia petrolearia DSM 11571]|uniref:UvrD/REP helicase n=2 Tax=Methanolacinia TaxID=230355 RepID=E1RJM6_METP4|nr:UvrD/REP helicase [Methanolacinia petrolearia DSM 11571]
MGLPPDAFDGERKEALKNLSTVDIQACPGSGKTTLLVAKLAILAKYWTNNKQGICILSHTNAARKEIEDKLGNTDLGKKLLSHPHFIGTIHGFFNQYIALPWIRSMRFPVTMIDTEVAINYRWKRIPQKYQSGISKNHHEPLNILSATDILGNPRPISWGKSLLKPESQTYQKIKGSINESFEKGIFTYDEVFVFTKDALNKVPSLKNSIQTRFLICFVDEAQDCTEEQNLILSKIFPFPDKNIIKQRFGDGNQAIFHNYNANENVKSEPFPQNGYLTISDSLRFNQKIAKLSDPLGLIPYNMEGKGGQVNNNSKNTIILFEKEFIKDVLPTFCDIIFKNFSQETIESLKKQDVYAVGMVHKKPDNSDKYTVVSYWTNYHQHRNKKDYNPNLMIDYLKLSINLIKENHDFNYGLNFFSKGLIRFINENAGTEKIYNIRNPYRFISNQLLLENNGNKEYLVWLYELFKLKNLDEEKWNGHIKPKLLEMVKIISDGNLPHDLSFFNWDDSSEFICLFDKSVNIQNNFHFNDGERQLNINLGSIHSIKGQTHFATLVLDTFWKGREFKTNLIYLIDWLTGDVKGRSTQNSNNNRLKCHYVAMTRPTDLLCLALPICFTNPDTWAKLRSRGWDLKFLGSNEYKEKVTLYNWF